MNLRPYAAADLAPLMDLWNAVKRDAYPHLPLEQTRTIAEDTGFFAGHILLYIATDSQRRGVGGALIAHARTFSPDALELHTHRKNVAACRFYERHGFVAVEYGVSPPPESEPDVRYRWEP